MEQNIPKLEKMENTKLDKDLEEDEDIINTRSNDNIRKEKIDIDVKFKNIVKHEEEEEEEGKMDLKKKEIIDEELLQACFFFFNLIVLMFY